VALVGHVVDQRLSASLEMDAIHHRGVKPNALRYAAATSMSRALVGTCDVASDSAAPRCAPLRSAPGQRYATCAWSMQAFGVVGRVSHRSPLHHRPNPVFNRTRRKQRYSLLAFVLARWLTPR
jgi:hypothetical protein